MYIYVCMYIYIYICIYPSEDEAEEEGAQQAKRVVAPPDLLGSVRPTTSIIHIYIYREREI